jgi:uncharacterized cupredoxin-like copper-binding protein
VTQTDRSGFNFQAAYNAAKPGDTIHVPAGTYDSVTIVRDPSKGTAGPAVKFVPDGVVTFTHYLHLGDPIKCDSGDSSGAPPTWVTFDGGSNKTPRVVYFDTAATRNFHFGTKTLPGQIAVPACYDDQNVNNDILPDHITLTYLQLEVGSPDPGNGAINSASPTNLTISQDRIGPLCCGNPCPSATDCHGVFDPTLSASTYEILIGHHVGERSNEQIKDAVNLTITANDLEGETHLASLWPAAAYGPPPQDDCGPCHGDGVAITSAQRLVFTYNRMMHSGSQGLFLEYDCCGGNSRDATIVGNYLDSLGSCSWCTAASTAHGSWLIAFNTSNAGAGFQGTDFPADFSAQLVGNYGLAMKGNDGNPNGCSDKAFLHYSYNVWTNDGGASNQPCGPGDIVVPTLTVVHRGDWPDNATNFDLPAARTPTDELVPASMCTPITTFDLHGTTRPSATNCEAGAYERPNTVTVTEIESGIKLSRKAVAHGRVTFVVHAADKLAHQFVVLRTKLPLNKLPMKGAIVDVKKAGKVLAKISLAKGKSKRLTLTLAAGRYVILSNLPGHYKAGQHAALRVT